MPQAGKLTADNPMSYHYRGPSIDHSLLSPSGRMSGRARKAAEKREHERLFPPGYWPEKAGPTHAEKAASKRQYAAELRRLAGCGMKPRVHMREALRLEAEAAELEQKAAD